MLGKDLNIVGAAGQKPVELVGTSSAAHGDPSQQQVEQSQQEAKPAATKEQVIDIIEALKERVPQRVSRDIHFAMHEETGRAVIRVVDRETDEVIREIPSEEILALAERLEDVSGKLFEDKA